MLHLVEGIEGQIIPIIKELSDIICVFTFDEFNETCMQRR